MSLLARSCPTLPKAIRRPLRLAAAYATGNPSPSTSLDINSILGLDEPIQPPSPPNSNEATLKKLLPSLASNALRNTPSTSSPDNPIPDSSTTVMNPFSFHAHDVYHADQLRLRLYAKCTHNNTILTLCTEGGTVVGWTSGGGCGFKNAQKASYEAGYQCAVQIFKKILDAGEEDRDKRVALHVLFSGRGQGREALFKALTSVEGDDIRGLVAKLTDRTPIKIGGTRAKKARRL